MAPAPCSPGSGRCWLWAGWLLVLSFCEASACLARGGLPSAELLRDNTELELHAEQDGATQPHSCGHCSLEDHQVLSPNSSPGCSMMHGLASRDALEIHIVHLFKSSSPPHPSVQPRSYRCFMSQGEADSPPLQGCRAVPPHRHPELAQPKPTGDPLLPSPGSFQPSPSLSPCKLQNAETQTPNVVLL